MSGSEDGPVGRRETAYRLFASEFEDADFSYAESDEERAPNYVVTPTGARINRLFVVGVLTEVQPVGEDVLRARVVDPTGAFVVYAGQYQPEAQAFLERTEPPTFVAVSGKARTFQPDDSDIIYTSIRPESINAVDADTRDRWTVQTAEQTLDRIGVLASALQTDRRGDDLREVLQANAVADGLAAGVPLAIDHYGTSGRYLTALRETALDAARVVAGQRDEVESRSVAPDAAGEADLDALTDRRLDTTSSASRPESPGEAAEGAIDTSTVEDDSRAGSASASEATTAVAETESTSDDTTSDAVASTSEPETEAATTETEAATTETEAATTESDAAASESDPATSDAEPATASSESATTEPTTTSSEDDDIGDFEPGEFDLDEETREEVKSEYGTEFQSGTEVDDPGEADIETPDPEEIEAAESAGAPSGAADADASPESAGAPTGDESPAPDAEAATSDAVSETPATDTEAAADETAADASESTTDEPAEDVDLEDAVMDAMTDLDDGDGADREAVTASVVEQTGADPTDVEDAIQDALMNGRCYEPDDETLKSI